MLDIRTAGHIYQLPGFAEIHLLGQLIDAVLFLYLIQNFFEPRKAVYRSRGRLAGVSILFTVVLHFTDKITQNSFYSYAVVMLLLPFLYACLFFKGKTVMKGLVCIIFFTMSSSIENLMGFLMRYFADGHSIAADTAMIIFLFRRIFLKAGLLLVIKTFMIDVVKKSTQDLGGYWYFMAAVCTADCVIYKGVLVKDTTDRLVLTQGLILSVFCLAVPLGCFYTISLVLKLTESNRVRLAQATWMSSQEQQVLQAMEMQEELRKFRHDYKAHLFCLDALVQEENYGEVHRYLEKLHQLPVEEGVIIPYTKSNVLNLVLNQKRAEAVRRGIDFTVKAELEAETFQSGHIQVFDINTLISNLCDNAIEAAGQVENGRVYVQFSRKKAYVQIEVENSTSGNVLLENPEFLTSKEEKELHGLGIKIVKNIVNAHEGIYETEATEHSLKTRILLMDE